MPINYRTVPISEKPEHEGWYFAWDEKKKNRKTEIYWTGAEWRYYPNVPNFNETITHWLQPVASSVVMTREMLHDVVSKAMINALKDDMKIPEQMTEYLWNNLNKQP